MKYRFRYWLGQVCKLFGFCRDCRGTLNFLPRGGAVCTNCRKRY